VHLAAAVNCTVFGIFNGSQYKRFAPYPKELAANFHAIYPDNVEAELNDPAIVKEKYEFVVDVPYASVPAEKVIHAIYVRDSETSLRGTKQSEIRLICC
jgi:ADP-heptose:LPS heptosyltransferase